MLCCYGCRYWNKGCTIKVLGCKLFLCSSIKNIVLQNRFRRLQQYANQYLVFDYITGGYKCSAAYKYYMSKEDWLKLLKESRSEKTHKTNNRATTKV